MPLTQEALVGSEKAAAQGQRTRPVELTRVQAGWGAVATGPPVVIRRAPWP